MKLKKSNFNWYGFKHSLIKKKFEGDLTYCGTFSIKSNVSGSYVVWAVYHSKNPNREKGHKDYMLLGLFDVNSISGKEKKVYVSGRDAKEMELERYQPGKYCPKCKDLIYSVDRHDYRTCKCGECSVDGGKDYFRCSQAGETVTIDLIEGETTVPNSIKFIKSLNKK